VNTRVLLVEDVKATAELITELLEFVGGFDIVAHCVTESAAQHWLLDHPDGADLVILDLMLREGSGFTVLSRIATGSSADVVVFSDFASPAVVRKCRSQGALDAISKSDYRRLRVFLEKYRGERMATAA
jgi:DNA-binding NarL/FixJ family response regulator